MANVLVTGGAGYIGSTTCKCLAESGHAVTVYDNLSTGHRDFVRWGELVEGDIRDTERLRKVMAERRVDGVVHFAASAYVGDSVVDPGAYYDNNVVGTLSILKAMRDTGVDAMVVSSSCAVYGQPDRMPITEETEKAPINPYGASKLMMERMCADFEGAHGIRTVALRYFNACGADPQLVTGERHDPEPHLIPRIFMAVEGEIGALPVFGSDYPTDDGTCVRDFIHVTDLADAHVRAIQHLERGGASETCNLGTGQGLSVRQVLDAAQTVTNRPIPFEYRNRRAGDPAELVANADRAREIFGWRPRYSGIDMIIQTAWHWHRRERESRVA